MYSKNIIKGVFKAKKVKGAQEHMCIRPTDINHV